MIDELKPKIRDAEMPDSVLDARAFAEELERQARLDVEAAVRAHIAASRDALDVFEVLLPIFPDTSDMDLTANSRVNALWLLSGRSVSLGMNLLHQIDAGYGVEAFPTARAIHETNRFVFVFSDHEEHQLLRRWLDGHTPKPGALRRAVTRIENRHNEERRARGLAPVEATQPLNEDLYRALSGSAHTARESLEMSLSVSRRQLVVGPSSDWGMRAYFRAWSTEVVREIVWTLGHAFAVFLGSDSADEIVDGVNARLEAVARSHPWLEHHLRRSPIEVEEIEEVEESEEP